MVSLFLTRALTPALKFLFLLCWTFACDARLAKGVSLQGLDKTTGRVFSIDAQIHQPVTFGTLTIIPRACDQSLEDSDPESTAFLEVWEKPVGGNNKKIFSTWMLSSSPAVSALDHPVYDIWVSSCTNF